MYNIGQKNERKFPTITYLTRVILGMTNNLMKIDRIISIVGILTSLT